MKHARIIFACTTFVMSFCSSPCSVAQGDSTVSFDTPNLQLSGLNNFQICPQESFDISNCVLQTDTISIQANMQMLLSGGMMAKANLLRDEHQVSLLVIMMIGVITSFTWARSMTNAQIIDINPGDESREVKKSGSFRKNRYQSELLEPVDGPS